MTDPDELRDAVAEHGWVVVTSPAGGGRPPTASTVGLTEQACPELVVLGLPAEVAGPVLHEVAERLLADFGEDDGVPLPDVLDGEAPVLLTVPGPLTGLPACDLYGEDLHLRQLVWPDADGRFPWHPGFAHPELQPLMGDPPLTHERVSVTSAGLPEWPLPDDPHLQVLTSRLVAEEGAPVLLVTCTDDGELWFLDGVSDFDPASAVVECLHEALERDLSLVDAVRPLHQGQVSERTSPDDPWVVDDW